jgi:hypothetical protein
VIGVSIVTVSEALCWVCSPARDLEGGPKDLGANEFRHDGGGGGDLAAKCQLCQTVTVSVWLTRGMTCGHW